MCARLISPCLKAGALRRILVKQDAAHASIPLVKPCFNLYTVSVWDAIDSAPAA